MTKYKYDESKLPKWVQNEISSLRSRIIELESVRPRTRKKPRTMPSAIATRHRLYCAFKSYSLAVVETFEHGEILTDKPSDDASVATAATQYGKSMKVTANEAKAIGRMTLAQVAKAMKKGK